MHVKVRNSVIEQLKGRQIRSTLTLDSNCSLDRPKSPLPGCQTQARLSVLVDQINENFNRISTDFAPGCSSFWYVMTWCEKLACYLFFSKLKDIFQKMKMQKQKIKNYQKWRWNLQKIFGSLHREKYIFVCWKCLDLLVCFLKCLRDVVSKWLDCKHIFSEPENQNTLFRSTVLAIYPIFRPKWVLR